MPTMEQIPTRGTSGQGGKVIIQIPCYNEAAHIAEALAELPRALPETNAVEFLVVDDGSGDGTAEAARMAGAHHVVSFPRHAGLARAFAAGLEHALQRGADVIVCTDADRPYLASDIVRLALPVLRGEVHLMVGCRDHKNVSHFSWKKKALQRLGAWVVSRVSGLKLPDVTSGFRAYSREAALRLHVFSSYSYTLETLIHAGRLGLAVGYVMVEPRPEMRPSRLYRNLFHYLFRSAVTILRVTSLYYPLRVFLTLAGTSLAAALALAGRYLYYYFQSLTGYAGHMPSLALAGVLAVLSVVFAVSGLLADLMASNRGLLEDVLYAERRRMLSSAPVKEVPSSPSAL